MDPLIRTLVRYQELSLAIARVDARLAQIPSEIRKIDDEEKAAAASIAGAKEHVVEAQKRRRAHESELQDLEGKIAKYNSQSREVKTNEQYRAILSEIQTVKSQIGEVEEKILLAMEEIDQFERKVREEEKTVAARRGEYDARRAVFTAERDRLGEERARLLVEQEAAEKDVDPSAMEVYNRMSRLRGGVAMARARDERCSGCNVRIRPQVFAEVRRNNQIIQCESCKRILYFVDEPPAGEPAPPADPAPDGPASGNGGMSPDGPDGRPGPA